MSRNSGGTYTLPSSVNPVVSGTPITDTWANTTLADIASALTDSLSRSGQGGMTAAMLFYDGTVSAPGMSFTNESTTGFYRAGAQDLRVSVGNTQVVQFVPTLVTYSVALTGTTITAGTQFIGPGTGLTGTAASFTAGAVTNGLYSTGSYSAPAWLIALATTVTINGYVVGYRDVPQNAQSGNYTAALGDAGKHLYSTNAGAQTFTLPTNASVAFPVGTAITIVNNGTTAITMTTTSTTVYKAGTSAAWASGGNLGVRGLCTFLKVATDTWFVSGSGLS